MPVTISPSDACSVLDLVASAWLRGVGTQASNLGIGLPAAGWGAGGPLYSLRAVLATMGETYLEPVAAIINPVLALANGLDGQAIMAVQLQPIYAALQAHVAASGVSGVSNFDSWLSYYNVGAGGPWQALMPGPAWAMFQKWTGLTNGLSASNTYFEVLQGATYTNALAKGVVSGPGACTPTVGFTVDSGHYAGGFPFLNASGITGSGLVTVTGTAFNPVQNAPVSGVTWTASVTAGSSTPSLAPGGSSPAPANSLIIGATNITVASGITAGTLYVEAHRPAGRPLLPE